jgi:putative hydrolase of HD superfamily
MSGPVVPKPLDSRVDIVHALAMPSRISQQMAFITELDKLKGVLRRTSPIGQERRENSAEHSWQVVLCAIILAEHATAKIDILKVIKMLAIHDTVEIDVGDTFHYDKAAQADLHEREGAAADRLFALLPEDQGQELRALWEEFEAKESLEARFAAGLDRMMPFVLNFHNQGGTWLEYNLTKERVLSVNWEIEAGLPELGRWIKELVDEAETKGFFAPAVEE